MFDSRAMDILFITWNFPPVLGGIEYLASRLAMGLRTRGHSVTVLTAYAVGVPPEEHVLRAGRPGLPAFTWFAALRGFSLCRARRPQAVMCGSVAAAPAAWILSRLFGIPYVVLAHGSELLRGGRLYRWAVRRLFAGAARVVANSRSTQTLLERAGITPIRIAVIHPGVETESPAGVSRAAAQERFPEWRGRRVLLSAGRLIRRKGLLEFVEQVLPSLAEEFPDVLLVIAGDDAQSSLIHAERMRAPIERAIERRSLSRHAVLTGTVPDDQLAWLFARADVFVMPCLETPGDVEGFGIVFLQAGLAGAPCVATRTGGIPEAVLDGRTGLLAAPGDFAEIRRLTARLLADETLRRELGRQGAERAKKEFDWSVITRQHEQVLNTLTP